MAISDQFEFAAVSEYETSTLWRTEHPFKIQLRSFGSKIMSALRGFYSMPIGFVYTDRKSLKAFMKLGSLVGLDG
jgi:hypothetical protein